MRHQPRSPLWRIRAALLVLALLALPFGAGAAMAAGATGCHPAHAMQGSDGDGAWMQAPTIVAGHDCCPAHGCMAVAVLPDTATTAPGLAPRRQYLPAAPPVRAWCPAPGPPVPIPGKLT